MSDAHSSEYGQLADDAREVTMRSLIDKLGVQFQLSDWSGDCFESLWRPAAFPWKLLPNLFPNPARLELAIWVEGRLVGLAHCVPHASRNAILIQAIEGDPDADCPLRGKRALIAIEAANFYAQALGKRMLLLQPLTEQLTPVYVDNYGFTDDRQKTGSHYLWREVPRQ